MITAIIVVICVLLVLGLTAAASSVRVLREYERGVVFRLGRLMEQRGPGLALLIPSIDRMVRISLRTVTLTSAAAGDHHSRQHSRACDRGLPTTG